MANDIDKLRGDVDSFMDSELSAIINTLIALAEDMHKWGDRRYQAPPVRVREMLTRDATMSCVVDSKRFMDLPEGFLGMRRLRVLDEGKPRRLDWCAPENLNYSASDRVREYTIHEQVEFNTDTAEGHTFEGLYFTPFTPLSDAEPTNWLLTNAYGVYLYATLMRAALYERDDEARRLYQSEYEAAVQSIQDAEERIDKPRGRARIKFRHVDTHGGLA